MLIIDKFVIIHNGEFINYYNFNSFTGLQSGNKTIALPPTITASDNCLGGNCRGEEGAIALGGNYPGGLSSGQFSGRQLYGGQLPR